MGNFLQTALIDLDEACRRYPEAMVAFDIGCSHLLHAPFRFLDRVKHQTRTLVCESSLKRPRTNGPRGGDCIETTRAWWRSEVGIWVRATYGIKSTPYVDPAPE